MSWPTVIKSDYAADKASTLARAEALRDRDIELGERGGFAAFHFAATSTTATSYATLATNTIYVARYWVGWYMYFETEAYYADSATGEPTPEGYIRFSDSTNATNGTAVTVTDAAYAWQSASKVLLTASGLTSFILEGYVATGGELFARNTVHLTIYLGQS